MKLSASLPWSGLEAGKLISWTNNYDNMANVNWFVKLCFHF